MPNIMNILATTSVLLASARAGVMEYSHKQRNVYVAPQNITTGCARFYISNPVTSGATGTKYWEVCSEPNTNKGVRLQIGAGIFMKIRDKYGHSVANSISYVSTGPECWVDIFTQSDLAGRGYEVTPLRNVDLAMLDNHDNPSEGTFNDNIMSASVRSTLATGENPDTIDTPAGVLPVAVYYRFENIPKQPADSGCGYFYDADPNVQGELDGAVVCVSQNQHLAHMNVKDLAKRGLILLNSTPSGIFLEERGPWSGDENHKMYYHSRGLRSSYASSMTASFFSSFMDDFSGFWQSFVDALNSVLTSIVAIFEGDSTTPAPTSAPAPAPAPADMTGIKYIVAPADADIAVFTEDNFQGSQTVIWAGTEKLVQEGTDVPVVNSFFVISKKYLKTVTPDETEIETLMTIKKAAAKINDGEIRDHVHNAKYTYVSE